MPARDHRAEEVAVERHLAERDAGARRRRAVLGQQPVRRRLVVALRRLREQLDALQPLDAARADVARHHRAQRRAVDRRQRLAVHLPREQDLRPARLGERDRDLVALRRVGLLGVVGAGQPDVARGGVDPRGGEHVGQRGTRPASRCRSPRGPTAPRRGCRARAAGRRGGCPRTAASQSARAAAARAGRRATARAGSRRARPPAAAASSPAPARGCARRSARPA